MDIDAALLEQALDALGQLLATRGHHYEAVAIGGGSLLLLGQIGRMTKDLDLVALVASGEFISAKPLPPDLVQAISDVGVAMDLGKEWLNAGPTSLLEAGLPEGFKSRMKVRHYGGLKHLRPTGDELQIAKLWCLTQDVSEGFAATLNEALTSMGAESGSP